MLVFLSLFGVLGLSLPSLHDRADVKSPRERTAERIAPAGGSASAESLQLKDGTTLRGVVSAETRTTVYLVARRAWLEKHAANYYQSLREHEAVLQRQAIIQLRDRLRLWIASVPAPSFVALLERQQRSAENLLTELEKNPLAAARPLVMLELPRDQVRRIRRQAAPRTRVLLHAWEHDLDDAEELSASELSRVLKARGVDATKPPADLSDQMTLRPQSEREWALRRALVEFAFLRKPEYQGTAGALLPVERGAPFDVAQLLQKLMETQLEDLLGGGQASGANEAAAIDDALRQAQAQGFRSALITLVEQDPAAGQVIVSSRFCVRIGQGNWEILWHSAEQANAADARPNVEAQVRNDPQVRAALSLLETLGGAIDAAAVESALRFGAATLEAQNAVSARFEEFVAPYVNRLDGVPPLLVDDLNSPKPAKIRLRAPRRRNPKP